MSTEEAPRELIPQESSQRLHRMQDFDSQEVKMSTAKHLPLEKFEAIDMPLDDSIAPGKRESGSNRGIIPSDAIDKAGEFSHPALFCPLEQGRYGATLLFLL